MTLIETLDFPKIERLWNKKTKPTPKKQAKQRPNGRHSDQKFINTKVPARRRAKRRVFVEA